MLERIRNMTVMEKRLFVVVGVLLLLVFCCSGLFLISLNPSTDPVEFDSSDGISVLPVVPENDIFPTEEPAPTLQPPNTEELEKEWTQEEILAYVQKQVTWSEGVASGYELLGVLMENPDFYNPEWVSSVKIIFSNIVDLAYYMASEPCPPMFENVKAYLQMYYEELNLAKKDLFIGLDTLDPDYIGSASEHILKATGYLRLATEELDKISQPNGVNL